MKKALLIMLLSISLLQGCALFQRKNPDAIITEKVVNIDPKALEPCSSLIKLDTISPDEDLSSALFKVLEVSTKNIEIASDCARKQDASIAILKKFANKENK